MSSELLETILKDIRQRRQLSPERVVELQFLCPDAFNGAAEILDHRPIMRCIARESRREFYTIDAKAKRSNCMVPGFCTCGSFCFHVAAKPEMLLCKHELAVRIADAVGLLQITEVDDQEWARKFSLAFALPMVNYAE
uniref:SWIM-type domain-containing protein n=1 Tax=Haptolina ericina TaxID=156174 RepID=A0A7S3AY48_9EUKA|mmetsp:Transcript_38331/g.87073  ORF Transcript_38331/g.87073 Transcript_38331/m.87073 type:complete len:138 (+) Transcript_38331:43-456(+)|eukprot:CAMPEP_0181204230 /NCGR_PEP_ID=MMETSP1096-20121128/19821_1 /TAXON_ID=156174 ORGANISM="Chrysochromulina ericina, Strain CCMP281" /NCGR_SAMPLE_ID=MMETSP1096 /ASSEMBLY_ACC=CAM_ASM_000453 /LENGTH=137 /DNA_ID=CAMNT_0023294909 /DNA_START=44 /DNA_END=457 /DNA_ORIENTATION=-